jgi:dCTP deaminase
MSILLYDQLSEVLHRPLPQRLVITPLLDKKQIGPSSVDLRLGTQFIQVRRHAELAIDPFDRATFGGREEVTVPFGEQFVLHPLHFVLGSTLEYIRLPNDLAGQVLGRSSWGRLGLVVATAVVVQAGFAGCLTLELANMGSVPLLLRPGLRVAQLCVWRAVAPATKAHAAEAQLYDAPLGPESSRPGIEQDELERLKAIALMLAGQRRRETGR